MRKHVYHLLFLTETSRFNAMIQGNIQEAAVRLLLGLAPQRGFEPPTYRLGGGRSILLSYWGIVWHLPDCDRCHDSTFTPEIASHSLVHFQMLWREYYS